MLQEYGRQQDALKHGNPSAEYGNIAISSSSTCPSRHATTEEGSRSGAQKAQPDRLLAMQGAQGQVRRREAHLHQLQQER